MNNDKIPEWWNNDKPWIMGDCLEVMKDIPDNSVNICITSPPYNVGIDYDNHSDNMSLSEYKEFTEKWLSEVYRILKNNGRLILNFPKVFKIDDKPLSTVKEILPLIFNIGFDISAEIIWLKRPSNALGRGTAWGSWMSASSPHLRCNYEYIWLFYKNDWKRKCEGVTTITTQEFMEYSIDVWYVKDESSKIHPAPYPVELVERILKFLTYKDDIVFDPFLGSGTTGVACNKLGRRWLGIEISEEYCRMAHKRIEYGDEYINKEYEIEQMVECSKDKCIGIDTFME